MSNSVEIIQVIHVVTTDGRGTKDDPVRLVSEYWSMDGRILARDDTFTPDRATAPTADSASPSGTASR